jgi:chromosome segregation ATPase
VAEDPFAKVKKMIQDMVYKLMEEANSEAEHKGFCDTELGTNAMTREQKTTAVNELSANIEEMTAKISSLSDEIGQLSAEIGEIDAAVAEATAIREEEKAKNTVTVQDAVGASTAVKQALGVLQAYYEGVSLVQKGSSHGPAQSSASTGVIGMLEVILSDFERLEADTKAAETTNQKEFEKFTTDSAQDKAVKEQHVKNKSETRTETDVANAQAKKDLKSTQEELDAAEKYYEELKPSCVESGNSYEDRVARRKEEIESLKEALKILDDQDI